MSETETEKLPDHPLLRRYYELRKYIGDFTVDLDKAYNETPRILEEAGVLAARADAEELAAKHTYEIIVADASVRIRRIPVNGKEPSEARVASLLPLEDDVQEARHEFEEAHYRAKVCQGLYKALDSQMRLLPKAADMSMTSYLSPSVALDHLRTETLRTEMRQARLAADNRVQREGTPRVGRPTS